MRALLNLLVLLFFLNSATAKTLDLPEHISQIKPSIVAIGLLNPTASPRITLLGTGFATGNGKQIATNYHIIAKPTDPATLEQYVVLSGRGEKVVVHEILRTETDLAHDVAILSIEQTLPALKLSGPDMLAEGNSVSLTGYPITSVLGLYPATHTGIIAAHSPVAIPAQNSLQLQTRAIRALKQPYMVYQLDATAYPGNSGSPLFSMVDGTVIGIINRVHVKSTKEAVLSDPSGITYAIPIVHVLNLLKSGTAP